MTKAFSDNFTYLFQKNYLIVLSSISSGKGLILPPDAIAS